MDPELKNMVTELLSLTRENNVFLRKIHNKQKWAQIYRLIYWFVILGIAFGGFYFIQPYLNSVFNYYSIIAGDGGAIDTIKNPPANGIPDLKHLQDLFNQL